MDSFIYLRKNTLLAAKRGCKCTPLTPLNQPLSVATISTSPKPAPSFRTVQPQNWMVDIACSRFMSGTALRNYQTTSFSLQCTQLSHTHSTISFIHQVSKVAECQQGDSFEAYLFGCCDMEWLTWSTWTVACWCLKVTYRLLAAHTVEWHTP